MSCVCVCLCVFGGGEQEKPEYRRCPLYHMIRLVLKPMSALPLAELEAATTKASLSHSEVISKQKVIVISHIGRRCSVNVVITASVPANNVGAAQDGAE